MIGGRRSRRPLDMPETDRPRLRPVRNLAVGLAQVRDAMSSGSQRLGRSVPFQVVLLVVLVVSVGVLYAGGAARAAYLVLGLFVAVQVSLLTLVLLVERYETSKAAAAQASADREAAERTNSELAYIMRELSEIRMSLGRTATRSFVVDQNDELARRLEHARLPAPRP